MLDRAAYQDRLRRISHAHEQGNSATVLRLTHGMLA
jgi:hypothetical protein